MQNSSFKKYIKDTLDYAIYTYEKNFKYDLYINGFILYQKYSRRDVCRILNWEKDEQSTMYGYKIKGSTCPIFVNYHKETDISSTTKYEERFINNHEFLWMSRSRRTLESEEIRKIIDAKNKLRLPLFIKKSNDEDKEFYYIGEVTPLQYEQSNIPSDNGTVPVVIINFLMNQRVEDSIYEYLTTK